MFKFLIIDIWHRLEASKRRPVSEDINRIIIQPGNLGDLHKRLWLVNLSAHIGNGPPYIEESNDTIFIRQQPFRARATVEMAPTEENVRWKVGWIQATDRMLDLRIHGNQGFESIGVPGLASGKKMMINDKLNTNDMWPWYDYTKGVVTFTGPSKFYQKATISVSDTPRSRHALKDPSVRNQAYLTHMTRDQSFYTWLVAWDQTADKAYIMKTIRWYLHWDLDVNVTKPRGERARLLSDPLPRQPEILADDVPIPLCAMIPPNCNNSYCIVWHPNGGKALCIRRPRWQEARYIEEWAKRILDPKILTRELYNTPEITFNIQLNLDGSSTDSSS